MPRAASDTGAGETPQPAGLRALRIFRAVTRRISSPAMSTLVRYSEVAVVILARPYISDAYRGCNVWQWIIELLQWRMRLQNQAPRLMRTCPFGSNVAVWKLARTFQTSDHGKRSERAIDFAGATRPPAFVSPAIRTSVPQQRCRGVAGAADRGGSVVATWNTVLKDGTGSDSRGTNGRRPRPPADIYSQPSGTITVVGTSLKIRQRQFPHGQPLLTTMGRFS